VSASSDPVATLREFVRTKRTGTVSIREGEHVAEVRLAAGNIEDAVYLGITGEKALYRALALAQATWSFEHRAGGMRRIRTPTENILAAAPRVLAEVERLRRALPEARERPLLAVELPPPPGEGRGGAATLPVSMSTSGRALLVHLRAPIFLEELLDRVPATDAEILAAVVELQQSGRARFLASPRQPVPLGTDEELAKLAESIVARKKGRVGRAVRLVLAGSPHRLAVIAHGVSCLEGASAPPYGLPRIPMPHTVARLPIFGELELEVELCPLVPAYSPLWPMAIKGALALVRIDEAAEHLVDQACDAAGVRPTDIRQLIAIYDPTDVADIAKVLVRALRG